MKNFCRIVTLEKVQFDEDSESKVSEFAKFSQISTNICISCGINPICILILTFSIFTFFNLSLRFHETTQFFNFLDSSIFQHMNDWIQTLISFHIVQFCVVFCLNLGQFDSLWIFFSGYLLKYQFLLQKFEFDFNREKNLFCLIFAVISRFLQKMHFRTFWKLRIYELLWFWERWNSRKVVKNIQTAIFKKT